MQSPLFAAGHFTVQDLGSQALPLLLPPGGTLVDLAAAPGGKSFAAIASGRARRAVALDRSLERLRLLEENRVRLGMPEVMPSRRMSASPPLAAGRFDRVLFDAPCSGTGTLRKSPEIRYRVTPASIERLAAAQEAGLLASAGLLAPGGLLLYATCSLEEEENERVVARVLARDPTLEPAPIEAPEGCAPSSPGPCSASSPTATPTASPRTCCGDRPEGYCWRSRPSAFAKGRRLTPRDVGVRAVVSGRAAARDPRRRETLDCSEAPR